MEKQEAVDNSNKYLPRPFWARVLVICAYLLIAGLLLLLLLRIIPAAAPFIVAWLLAWALSGPIEWISSRSRMRRGVIAAAVTAAVIAVLIFGVFSLGELLVSEAGRLLEKLGRNAGGIGERVDGFTRLLGERFPALDDIGGAGAIESGIGEMIKGLISKLTDLLADLATAIVTSVPSLLLFVTVCVVAAFYFTCGYPAITASLCRMIPPAGRSRVFEVISRAVDMVKYYLRANLIICGVTFCIILLGFGFMSFEYVVLSALLIALVDFLPVFGAGAVLLPWGIFMLLSGDLGRGFGLFIVYACCGLARQLLEPRLISEKVGLHPAATLAAMYFGYDFFGFFGMLLAPMALMLVTGVEQRGNSR